MRVLGERLNGIQEVKSSILSVSTMKSVIVMITDFFLYVDLLKCCFVYDIINLYKK